MNRSDWGRFQQVLQAVSDLYGKQPMSDIARTLFFNAMEPYPFELFQRAMSQHIKDCQFFPRPADLVKILEGTAEDRGRVAWRKVLKACSDVGVYRSVRFEDPRIHYAVSCMGGWVKVGQIEEKELPFREKDFLKHYRDAERMRVNWDSPGVSHHLVGHCEVENRMSGHDPEPPVMIGAPRPRLEAVEASKMREIGAKVDHSGETNDMITSLTKGVRVG